MNIFHALESQFKLCDIVYISDGDHVTLIHIVVVTDFVQAVLREEPLRQGKLFCTRHLRRLEYLVENVKVAFFAVLEANARLLEQVVDDGGRVQHACPVKIHLNKLAETRRVVVLKRLRVAKGLQQGIRVKHLLFD